MQNNKHTMVMRGSQLMFNECDMFGDQYKKLQTGLGFFIAVDNGRSFDVNPANIVIKPSEDQNYIYAKWPAMGGNGDLIHTTKPMPDDSKFNYILVTSGTYSQIDFK